MSGPISLPEGYRARPLTPADLQAIFEVVAACEKHSDGEVEVSLSDIEADWARPEFDPAIGSLGIEHGGALIAFAEVFKGNAEVDVLPAHRGLGIGTALLAWSEHVACADGRTDVGQTVSDARHDATSLFSANRYEPRWTSWLLQIVLGDEPPDPPSLPPGFAFRDYAPDVDDREVFAVIDGAFTEWPDYESHGFDNFMARFMRRPEVRSELVPLIVANGRIVGVAVGYDYGPDNEGWIQHLAVDAAHRGNGLGRALLQESFRRFHALGRRECGLSTDSRTGALGLYEHVGMHVRLSYTRHAKTF
jgi:mycothiol synthase